MVCKGVSELEEHSPRILTGVRGLDPMVELNLYLTPPGLAMLGQAVDEGLVILLGWVKVGVTEGAPISIAPSLCQLGILPTPPFEAPLLLVQTGVGPGLPRHDGGLEVVGHGLEDCYCSHAEENAIVQSAYHGVNINDTTLYSTFSPCLLCTKMIINSGIKEVVYSTAYPLGEIPMKLLAEAGIAVRQHEA